MNTTTEAAGKKLAALEGPRRAGLDEVPILDLAPLGKGGDISALARALRKACTDTAFFYVSHHGVPDEAIEGVLGASRRFFEAPRIVREGALRNEFNRGYLPIGTSKIASNEPDLKDSFDIGIDLPLDHPAVIARKPFHGPNKWPDLPGFREPVEAYFREISGLGLRLLRVFARSLDLGDDFFTKLYTDPMVSMRMLHYPVPPESDQGISIGTNEHTDFGIITLLYQDPAGGLELQKPSGEWIAAPFIPGTFVINLGDLMARWTNDLFRSTRHRVVNRLGHERYSIATFFNPTYETVVSCLPTCLDRNGKAKYEPIGTGQYVSDRVRATQYR